MSGPADLALPWVQGLHPYLPGKPVEELVRERGIDPSTVVKLASNENPRGPSPHCSEAIREATATLARYPDGATYALRRMLSERLQVSPEQLLFGNGSNELLVLLAECWLQPGCSAVVSEYAFVVYDLAVRAAGAETVTVPSADWGHDLQAMADSISSNTRMIFLANPNNPTGTAVTRDEFIGFMERVPETVLVVLDEAYLEYTPQRSLIDGASLVGRFKNLVVTRTFSKAYGLAGLRIGYAIADSSVAGIVNRLRQPFNVNSLAEVAALAALGDDVWLDESLECNRRGLEQLSTGVAALGLRIIPSSGNFVAFNTGMDATLCYNRLLEHGVIARPLANYGMPEHLRVSVGIEHENERFLHALAAVL